MVTEGPAVAIVDARAPDSRVWTAAFDREVTVDLRATDGSASRELSTAGRSVAIDLVALGADSAWTVEAVATDGIATVDLPPVTFATAPLPEAFPRITVRASEADAAPGITLLAVRADGRSGSLVVAVDADGRVLWRFEETDTIDEVALHGDGILVQTGASVRVLDWAGRTRALWGTVGLAEPHVPVDVPNFHHELFQAPDGAFATLANVRVDVDDFPLSYTDPDVRGDATLLADRLVAFEPDTGEITLDVALTDVLDPRRIGYDALRVMDDGSFDWSHANGIAYDEARGLWIVSSRNQDAIAAFDATGELAWLLGTEANWTSPWSERRLAPVGDVQWPYKQHAPDWDDGRLLVFDNAYAQASPFTGEMGVANDRAASRVVEYAVDPEAGTVAQAWQWSPEPPVFTASLGDVDRLVNGHVLAVWGDCRFEGGRDGAARGTGPAWARVIELDPHDPAPVWDLELWAPAGAEPDTWRVYRAERVPDPR